MKIYVLIMSFVLCQFLHSQTVADFENFGLGLDSALIQGNSSNGEIGNGFYSGDIFFPNNYNAEFDFFTDWAISSKRDTISAGSTNATSAFAGTGKSSDTYAVASAFSPVQAHLVELSAGKIVTGIYVTNNTYAALSMRDGDAFAKRFGGESGDDPDFFLLTIKVWLNGELSNDSVNFYLADYRFPDNAQDYIVKDWTYVSLDELGAADSLEFSLSSSDVGAFGMNTPAYFCVDNLLVEMPSSVNQVFRENIDLKITPNPSSDYIIIESDSGTIYIYDQLGRQVLISNDGSETISVFDLESGLYYVKTAKGELGRFIKT